MTYYRNEKKVLTFIAIFYSFLAILVVVVLLFSTGIIEAGGG